MWLVLQREGIPQILLMFEVPATVSEGGTHLARSFAAITCIQRGPASGNNHILRLCVRRCIAALQSR